MKNVQISCNDLVGNRFNGYDLHHQLNEIGIDSTCLVWDKKSNDTDVFEIASNSQKRLELNAKANDLNQKYSTQAIFNPYSAELFSNKFFLDADVAHYHLIHNNFFNLSHMPVLSALKPTVWTLHDPWAMTGHCIYPSGCERWKIGCGYCPDLNIHFAVKDDATALNWEMKRIYYQNSRMDVIVASQYMMNMVEKSPLFSNARKHLVPFGLDLNTFCSRDSLIAKRKLGIDDDELVLCFRNVGSTFKGIEYINELLLRLEFSGKICLLTFNDVGNLEAYKSKYKIVELGWVLDEETIVNAYNAADIFLMPSKEEAFGMMAMEAMACAKTVVVMDGTSLSEIVYPQLSGGVVVAQGDVLGFCKVVEDLITNKEKREYIGQQARKVAEEKYNLSRYIDDILKVYQTAIREHKDTFRKEFL